MIKISRNNTLWLTSLHCFFTTGCVYREYEPPSRRLPSTKSDLRFEYIFPDWAVFGSGYLPDHFQNVDSLSCLLQSFRRQLSWKAASDCTRNANKSPKSPIPQWRGKWKSDPDRMISPPVLPISSLGLIITPCFDEIGWLLLQ